ncbi:MAG TPA: FAD-dependent monooxygenase [Stellaceae bacterium]|jgi:2-polyprenyl-6-methoxyphenol hydroxylase-like FAD-dependent oxidoreductase|nr:FAD-dependent monooxygenase [Stellaceae bacterium]
MPPLRRALVIGGSIGGLFAGQMLRQAGWDVAIFERSAGDLADRGAGLNTSAELFAAMRRVGAAVSPELAFHVRSSAWLRQDGTIGVEIPRGWHGSTWGTIYRLLRAAFPSALYHAGKVLERVEPERDGVTAIFADGAHERCDLLIAADGVYSTVRKQFLPELAPVPAGYVAWRGILEERDLPAAAHELLLQRAAFSFPENELVVSLPVPGADNDPRPGHRRYYFIWYRPAAADEQRAFFTDATGWHHGLSIPPPLIRGEFIAAMKAAARRGLPPVIGEIVNRVAQPLLQSITDLAAPRLVFGRVALLGDSAFVARPHVAAGTTKAALDAAALVAALDAESGDIDAALQRYERERGAFGRALIAHARHLGAYLEAPASATKHRDPEQVLRDYGAPHLVRDVDEA